MPATREKLLNEPIVIVTLSEDYDFATEAAAGVQENLAFLDSLDEPVYYVTDTSAVDFDLGAVIEGSNLAARGTNPLFHHPNIRSVIYVTQSILSALAAKGMGSDAFGNLNIKVFGTLDEALAHVRTLA
jgi:hypothetical protein